MDYEDSEVLTYAAYVGRQNSSILSEDVVRFSILASSTKPQQRPHIDTPSQFLYMSKQLPRNTVENFWNSISN